MMIAKNELSITYGKILLRKFSPCHNPEHMFFLSQVSECSKSEGPSLSTSPGSDFLTSPAHRSVPLTSRHFSRTSSRASQSSLQSPSKSTGTSPPKTGSSNSLNKFHNRLVDKLKRSLKKAEDCAEDQRNLS